MGRNDICFCGSGKKQKKCHSDIKNDSAFGEIIAFHESVNKIINENTKFDKLKCKKGCSECCYQNFPISTVEFYYVIYNILNKQGIEKVREYVTKGYNMWLDYEKEFPENARILRTNIENMGVKKTNSLIKFIENSYETSPIYNRFPCPFLNTGEGSCEVYEDRPFVCRHFGVGYLEKHDLPTAFCSHTEDGIMYEDYMADLRGLVEEAMKSDTYYAPKYNTNAYDRPYPIFYYCKVTYEHLDSLEFKIREMKDISKEQFANNRVERAMKRQR